jgi:N-methylhydantoinase B/oxoprolinase/acetone carboxylase alpha subunit
MMTFTPVTFALYIFFHPAFNFFLRFPEDNVADLKAQIAANKRGIDLVLDLIRGNGLAHVLSTMTEGEIGG